MNDTRETVKRGSRPQTSLKRLVLIITVAFVLPVALFWIVMAQPSLVRNKESQMTVEPAKLHKHVLTFSETYYPRSYLHVSNLNMCADYILEHFKQAGADSTVQEFKVGNSSYRNVIGFFGPNSDERIVIGAHYDAYNGTPGADDNASGVAGLIELAYLLGKSDLDTRVELVAYTLEEPPFFRTRDMGSARHARRLKEEKVKVRAMIALEMIGFFSDAKNSQSFPIPLLKLFYPSRANFIGVVGRLGQGRIGRQVKQYMRGATDLAVHSINAPSFVPGIDLSDHRNYWKQGYRAVMITDTAFYRNHRYHEHGDTADTLDYERMAQVVVAVFEAIQGLCGQTLE